MKQSVIAAVLVLLSATITFYAITFFDVTDHALSTTPSTIETRIPRVIAGTAEGEVARGYIHPEDLDKWSLNLTISKEELKKIAPRTTINPVTGRPVSQITEPLGITEGEAIELQKAITSFADKVAKLEGGNLVVEDHEGILLYVSRINTKEGETLKKAFTRRVESILGTEEANLFLCLVSEDIDYIFGGFGQHIRHVRVSERPNGTFQVGSMVYYSKGEHDIGEVLKSTSTGFSPAPFYLRHIADDVRRRHDQR